MGISIGDSLAATFACVGALSALHYREKTGRGQVVDSAIYEAVLNMMESLLSETPGGIHRQSPELGEHNDEVYLQRLGLSRERYERLKAGKVI